MERFVGDEFNVVGCTVKKKRSNTHRRPCPNLQSVPNRYNLLPGNGRNDENQKVRGPIVVSDGFGSKNKLKKVKLKLGGVTRTIHTNITMDIAIDGGSSAINSSHLADAHWPQQIKNNIDSSASCLPNKRKGLQGVPQMDLFGSGSSINEEYSWRGKTSGEGVSVTEPLRSEPLCKSKRIPKRHVLDVGFSDDDEDEEIQYLGRLNASKFAADYKNDEEERHKKDRRKLKVSESSQNNDGGYVDKVYGLPRLGKDGRKKSRSEKIYEETDYVEEEEPTSDDEPKAERKTLREESIDLFTEGKNEITLLTRKRAAHFSKDGATFNDLPHAPPKTKKEKLSEVEQQLKKAEAAERRRLQSEKAAREAEAEAIRKILGQDSARKMREEKMKQQRDEVAQGKSANIMTLASNTIRWVMGPTGTTVTFSEDIGLPSIFKSAPFSYPPPREKCVGPNCTNSYKYRDSKSKLPLCSLHCYKAIHRNVEPLTAA